MNHWSIRNDNIACGNKTVIEKAENFTLTLLKSGAYIQYEGNEEFSEKEICIGHLKGVEKFNACYKFNACWYRIKVAKQICEIPFETEFLIMKMSYKKYIMLVPMVDERFKNCIYGGKGDDLMLLSMSGSSKVKTKAVNALYMLCGEHPNEMIETMSQELCELSGRCRLKKEKKLPEFVQYFGWCTYNAMYDDIDHDKMINALKRYKQNGCIPGFVIMDVGWQQTKGHYLSGLEEDKKKFPLGLEKTVKEAKLLGVNKYLAWHTYCGFWNGLDNSLLQYNVQPTSWQISKFINKHVVAKNVQDVVDTTGEEYYPSNIRHEKAGMPTPDFYRFYYDYYHYLKSIGIDGTKIDAIAWIEALAEDYGGKVEAMRRLVTSAEGASETCFGGELICCSGTTNEFLFQSSSANVVRVSPDFMPDIPESHGAHVYTCANTSFWMGEFITPDWDMFQSGHESGVFHAMARAISGEPVYSTDEVGKEDFDTIKKICVNTNQIPLCIEHAKICADSLFVNPEEENTIIKIYNKNQYNYVIGTFCCSWFEDTASAKCDVMLSDIYGLSGEDFAAYSYIENKVYRMNRETVIKSSLARLQSNIYTIAPIINGIGVIGITDVYNAGGTVTGVDIGNSCAEIETMCGGKLVLICDNEPKSISSDRLICYQYSDSVLSIHLEGVGTHKIVIQFD